MQKLHDLHVYIFTCFAEVRCIDAKVLVGKLLIIKDADSQSGQGLCERDVKMYRCKDEP